MAYDIGPRIGIQGEAEFNKQIKQINNALRECGSEMKALSSEFEDNANSQDALIAKNKNLAKEYDLQRQKMNLLQDQYEKQTVKLNELAQAYQKAKNENGEMSKEAAKAENAFNRQAETVSKLSVAMNETQNYINGLDNAMRKNNSMLDDMEKGYRDLSGELTELGEAAQKTDDELKQIASNTRSEALSGLAENISAVGDAMSEMVDESKEYLSIMGQLDASSQRLGYSAKDTEQTYTQLYGVLGDTQTAATATANLQALGLSQSDLTQMTELAIGAWAQYGDSIPIDSLAEAINETAQVGTVTGTFADALNWAGISEDEFNEKLASTSSESERARMIMEVLKSQGLDQVAQGYRDTNSALIESNEAQAQYDEAMAKLGELIMPMVSTAMEKAADVIGKLVEWFTSLPGPAQEIITVLGTLIIIVGALAPPILTCVAALSMLQAPLLPLAGIILGVIAAITAIILVIQNWGAITEWLGGVWEAIKTKLSEIWNSIKETASNVFTAIKDFLVSIWEAIKSAIGTAVNAIKTVVTTAWNAIKTGITTIVNAIKTVITTVWNAIKNVVTTVTNSIKNGAVNGFKSLVNGIKGAVSGVSNIIQNAFDAAINFITSLPGKALQWGRDFINGLKDGIMAGVNGIVSAVKGIGDKIRSFLHFSRPDEGPLRDYEKWMPDFMTGLANGIYDNIDKVQKAASAVSGTIDSTITGRVTDMANNVPSLGGGMIVVDGDTITLDGKAIGKSATKYITYTQAGSAASKGRRLNV